MGSTGGLRDKPTSSKSQLSNYQPISSQVHKDLFEPRPLLVAPFDLTTSLIYARTINRQGSVDLETAVNSCMTGGITRRGGRFVLFLYLFSLYWFL
jgi:hypothetical protein